MQQLLPAGYTQEQVWTGRTRYWPGEENRIPYSRIVLWFELEEPVDTPGILWVTFGTYGKFPVDFQLFKHFEFMELRMTGFTWPLSDFPPRMD